MKSLKQLLSQGKLWHGGQSLGFHGQVQGTGYDGLDELLPGRGWPRQGVVEILLSRYGIGELSLLLPALAELSQEERWLLWVSTPYVPDAFTLASVGIDMRKLIFIPKGIHQKQQSVTEKEQLWAVEQGLAEGGCGVVIASIDQLTITQMRRLQLAAEKGEALCFLFRSAVMKEQASLATLRLLLTEEYNASIGVQVIKRRQGWPLPKRILPIPPLMYRTVGSPYHHSSQAELNQEDNSNREVAFFDSRTR